MALDKTKLDPTGSGSKGVGAIGIYANASDTLATMFANGYFDAAYNELAQTKKILLVGSDGMAEASIVRTAPTDVALTELTLTPGLTFGTAVAVAGAATLAKGAGKITTEALTTVQNAIYTLTITDTEIAAADLVFASVANGTNTQGTPMIGKVTPGAGSVAIQVINKHATAEAFNGTVVVSFHAIKVAA